MANKPGAAIFADRPAVTAYLRQIARLAGFDPDAAEDPVVSLVSGPLPANLAGGAIWLGGQADPQRPDLYAVKIPVRAASLIERLVSLRRAASAARTEIVFTGGALDIVHNVWTGATGNVQKLTDKETAILVHLYRAAGAPIGRDELLRDVWEYVDGVETHTLETHIYRLRQKIEPDPSQPSIIVTSGDGYRIAL